MSHHRTLAAAWAFGLLAAVLSASPLRAQTSASQLAHRDRKVLEDLHASNLQEIAMGRLAQEKAQSADVKSYGEMLVTDHTDADAKVRDVAEKHGVTFAPEGKQSRVERLRKKSGTDFDQAFIKDAVDDHRKDIKDLDSAQKDVQSQDVRDLVGNLLPTLQKHEDRAVELQRAMTK